MELVRDIVSKGAPVEQFQHELKCTSQDREDILDAAMGGAASFTISAEQVMAMKADLSITWNKLRVMRR